MYFAPKIKIYEKVQNLHEKISLPFLYNFIFGENIFLFKNPRQLKHKGNHIRATGEGIKSFHLYR